MLEHVDDSCFVGADFGPALQAGARAAGAVARSMDRKYLPRSCPCASAT